jgi:hypothetical protein
VTATLVVITETPTTVPATPSPTATKSATPTSTPTVVHTYYLSTYETAHYYYCDTDPGWHDLSLAYLAHLNTLAEVLARYPTRTLHAPC